MGKGLDQLNRRYLKPLMQRAGYVCAGKDYFRPAEVSGYVCLSLYPSRHRMAPFEEFSLHVHVASGVWLEYQATRFVAPRHVYPDTDWMLEVDHIAPPPDFAIDYGRQGWRFDPDTQLDACGDVLVERVKQFALPVLDRLSSRSAFLHALETGVIAGAYAPGRHAQVVAALMDVADDERLRDIVARRSRGWSDRRLHRRPARLTPCPRGATVDEAVPEGGLWTTAGRR